MNFRLYKPGQGYWMRVLTAAFFGTLVLAAAAWLWNESKAISIPVKGYVFPVEGLPTGVVPVEGDTVQLLGENPDPTGVERIAIGRGTIQSVEITSTGANITTGRVETDAGRDVLDATRFSIVPAAGSPYEVRLYGNIAAKQAFDQLYLQAGLASLAILLGALLLFYYVGVHPRTSEFLIATDGEIRKVNWSTRREIVGSTWVVVTACFLLAGALFVVDFLFAGFFEMLGVIDRGN